MIAYDTGTGLHHMHIEQAVIQPAFFIREVYHVALGKLWMGNEFRMAIYGSLLGTGYFRHCVYLPGNITEGREV